MNVTQFLAHAEKPHTQSATNFQHFLTDATTLSFLFLLGVIGLSWVIRSFFDVNQWQRTAILGAYCLLAAGVSANYNLLLSFVSFSLAIFCGVSAAVYTLHVIPEPRNNTKKPTAKK